MMPSDLEGREAYLALLTDMLEDATPILDERDRLIEIGQARTVIHGLSILLHEIASHPAYLMIFGAENAKLGLALSTVAHAVSCDEDEDEHTPKHNAEEPEVEEVSQPKENTEWKPSKPLRP